MPDDMRATCEHRYDDVSGWGGCASGTLQCRHCNRVTTRDKEAQRHANRERPGGA